MHLMTLDPIAISFPEPKNLFNLRLNVSKAYKGSISSVQPKSNFDPLYRVLVDYCRNGKISIQEPIYGLSIGAGLVWI